MSISYKADNVEISAVRDRAMFNTFAGDQSYILKGIGQELAVTSSTTSFVVSLGTGEAVICGGSMLSEGGSTSLTLQANQSGYVVIEVDLSQTGDNICQFKNVSSLTQGNINNGTDMVYDLPLYQYTTNASGVFSFKDVRNILNSSFGTLATVARTGKYSDLTGKPTIPSAITVDTALSSSSTNPVQNKVINTALNGKAPTSHASSATTYGVGTTSNYGHVKLANNVTTASSTNGLALDAYQGKVLNDKITTVTNTINDLDYTGTGSASKTISKITQTNGKISATFSDISIASSKVTGLATVATSGSYNDLSNKPTITGMTATTLYTNSSPKATFGSKSVTTTGLSGYKLIEIQYFYSTLTSSEGTFDVYGSAVFSYNSSNYYSISTVTRSRFFKMSANAIRFYNTYTASGTTEYNNTMIPYKIIGYK